MQLWEDTDVTKGYNQGREDWFETVDSHMHGVCNEKMDNVWRVEPQSTDARRCREQEPGNEGLPPLHESIATLGGRLNNIPYGTGQHPQSVEHPATPDVVCILLALACLRLLRLLQVLVQVERPWIRTRSKGVHGVGRPGYSMKGERRISCDVVSVTDKRVGTRDID